jgi:hypothetical protein
MEVSRSRSIIEPNASWRYTNPTQAHRDVLVSDPEYFSPSLGFDVAYRYLVAPNNSTPSISPPGEPVWQNEFNRHVFNVPLMNRTNTFQGRHAFNQM